MSAAVRTSGCATADLAANEGQELRAMPNSIFSTILRVEQRLGVAGPEHVGADVEGIRVVLHSSTTLLGGNRLRGASVTFER